MNVAFRCLCSAALVAATNAACDPSNAPRAQAESAPAAQAAHVVGPTAIAPPRVDQPLGSATGSTTPVNTAIATPLVAMARAADVAPEVRLPLVIELRGPARIERTAEGSWLVRIDVHVTNHFDRAAICERAIFHATAHGAALVPDAAVSTLEEMIPLAPGQSVDGIVAWTVPAGVRAPTRVNVTYGMRDEQLAVDVPVE